MIEHVFMKLEMFSRRKSREMPNLIRPLLDV